MSRRAHLRSQGARFHPPSSARRQMSQSPTRLGSGPCGPLQQSITRGHARWPTAPCRLPGTRNAQRRGQRGGSASVRELRQSSQRRNHEATERARPCCGAVRSSGGCVGVTLYERETPTQRQMQAMALQVRLPLVRSDPRATDAGTVSRCCSPTALACCSCGVLLLADAVRRVGRAPAAMCCDVAACSALCSRRGCRRRRPARCAALRCLLCPPWAPLLVLCAPLPGRWAWAGWLARWAGWLPTVCWLQSCASALLEIEHVEPCLAAILPLVCPQWCASFPRLALHGPL